jgi:hypothetical protein
VYPDLDRLVSIARSLRPWIGDPRRMRVDFTATVGSTLDPQVQEPWKTPIPDAPVRWVVFPALIIAEHIVAKQLVYTASYSAARSLADGRQRRPERNHDTDQVIVVRLISRWTEATGQPIARCRAQRHSGWH